MIIKEYLLECKCIKYGMLNLFTIVYVYLFIFNQIFIFIMIFMLGEDIYIWYQMVHTLNDFLQKFSNM